MRGERIKDRKALINRYGFGQRLAARIVALLSKNVALSETLLESIETEPALQKILLDRRLLSDAAELEEREVRGLAGEHGYADADILRVVSTEDGWRIIALEDDLLAEEAEGEGEPGATPEAALARRSMDLGRSGISRSETEGLFEADDVAKLKLTALTSQNADKRIEALRKLVYAPATAASKASMFVNVLTDETAASRVQREAVRALEQIGLRHDVAAAVRQLFEAEEGDVLYALQRMGSLIADAEEAEVGIALTVMLEVFDECDSTPVIKEIMQICGGSAHVLARSNEKTRQFAQTTLHKLARFDRTVALEARKAFQNVYRQIPGTMKTILWEELHRSDDPTIRSFLIRQITVCGEIKNLDELSELAVSQIIAPKLPEDQRSQLRYSLIEMAEPAAQAVLNRIEEETGMQRTQLVSLLDVLCTEGEVSPKTLNKATRSLLNLLAAGERNTRRRVLEAAFLADDRVDVKLKKEVASELLSHMSEFKLRSTRDTICYSLEQIGIPAIEPILTYIERRYPHEETDEAFHTLGRIAKKFGDDIPEPLAADALEYCLSLFDKPYTKRGAFIIALAWLAGYTSAGKKRFEKVIKELRDRLWKSKYSFDILEALGVIAGSRNVLKEHQRDLFELFATIVNKQSPEVLGRRRETSEGTVYEFGAEVMFDTRVIPAVVKGLERLGVSEITPNEIRTEIVKKLLILWEGVSNVRVIWGPASVESLVSAMSSVACCRMLTSDLRARLGRALLKFLNKVSVVEGLGHVCSMDDKNRDMRKLCLQTANAMLSEWEHCDQQDQERRIYLLNSMSRIAANTALEPQNEDVRKMRENVIEALFQGLRSGIREVIEPLKRLRKCPDIPEEQRKLIKKRLANVAGLIHIH